MSANVTTKTVFKMFGVPPDGRIAREDFEKDAKDLRDAIKHLNPAEADKVYGALMSISDIFGLDKYAKDGGLSYNAREFEIVRRIVARKDLPDANRVLHSAYFRAIDTNGNRLLERGEWTKYLKIRKTYVSEEQARKSFDSLDKNKNGVISLEEFVEGSVDFWCNLGEGHGAQDMYGTKDL